MLFILGYQYNIYILTVRVCYLSISQPCGIHGDQASPCLRTVAPLVSHDASHRRAHSVHGDPLPAFGHHIDLAECHARVLLQISVLQVVKLPGLPRLRTSKPWRGLQRTPKRLGPLLGAPIVWTATNGIRSGVDSNIQKGR